ncbi:MAG TPA: hypothetical protein VIM99_01420 [Blastocatellia bacterium]
MAIIVVSDHDVRESSFAVDFDRGGDGCWQACNQERKIGHARRIAFNRSGLFRLSRGAQAEYAERK